MYLGEIVFRHSEKDWAEQTFALAMDDDGYTISTLGLQKDSEFTEIFNHYILRGIESGCFKKLFSNYYVYHFAKENFEMIEPQPLGYDNVMFCFACLAVGIILSVIECLLELIVAKVSKEMEKKMKKYHREAWTQGNMEQAGNT